MARWRKRLGLKIKNSTNFESRVVIFQSIEAIDMGLGLELPQFSILGHRTADCTKTYTSGQYTCIRADFVLEREIGYYMIQIYIPSFLIVVLR